MTLRLLLVLKGNKRGKNIMYDSIQGQDAPVRTVTGAELRRNDYLSHGEIVHYRQKLNYLENTIKNYKNSPYDMVKSIEITPYIAEAKKIKKLLQERTPPKVRPQSYDKLRARAADLERVIINGMPSHSECWGERKGNKHDGYHWESRDMVNNKYYLWEKQRAPQVAEWKSIMRILYPDNPGMAIVERLRKKHGY